MTVAVVSANSANPLVQEGSKQVGKEADNNGVFASILDSTRLVSERQEGSDSPKVVEGTRELSPQDAEVDVEQGFLESQESQESQEPVDGDNQDQLLDANGINVPVLALHHAPSSPRPINIDPKGEVSHSGDPKPVQFLTDKVTQPLKVVETVDSHAPSKPSTRLSAEQAATLTADQVSQKKVPASGGAEAADRPMAPQQLIQTAMPAQVAGQSLHQSLQPRSRAFRGADDVGTSAAAPSMKAKSRFSAEVIVSGKLDAKTELFVQNLDQSMALTRRFSQADAEQAGSRPTLLDAASQAQAALTAAATPSLGALSQSHISGTPVMLGVPTHITNPQWAQAMSQQLVTFVRADERAPQVAQMRLDPPELGPIKVSITIAQGVASATFVSPHSAVRQTIEQALPQLAQALADAGIDLGQSNVSDQDAPAHFGQEDRREPIYTRAQSDGAAQPLAQDVAQPVRSLGLNQGLVRAYA